MKCPSCADPPDLVPDAVERETDGITYTAPVERCPQCGEILSGAASALAQLEALHAAGWPHWNQGYDHGRALRRLREWKKRQEKEGRT